eukprot:TRINITY_DN86654_c0_g1_i1.p1 TRINITY_DN86654_c0_g1~~TRINITY_DN86654_c0_g1_i1.p1  ORF type:complete len:361 (-),score=34.17 TRINITY_DN86654_c0_g1_i1:618-1700(-)
MVNQQRNNWYNRKHKKDAQAPPNKNCFIHSPYGAPVPVPAAPSSPTTPPSGSNQVSKRRKTLCLDYLHGECSRKRQTCGYYHPDVTNWPAGVCWAFFATGFCKYGVQCELEHPRTCANVADIALTKGMTKDQRNRGIHAKQVQRVMCQDSFKNKPKLSAEQKIREAVNSYCAGTDHTRFDNCLNQTHNHDLLSCALVDCVLSTQDGELCKRLPEQMRRYNGNKNFSKLVEILVVTVCGKITHELKEAGEAPLGFIAVRLLEFLWFLFYNECGQRTIHASAIKTMCQSNCSMVDKVLAAVPHLVSKVDDRAVFNEWSALFVEVREAIQRRRNSPPQPLIPLEVLVAMQEGRELEPLTGIPQ